MTCLSCKKEFMPSKNDERIKFCSETCRVSHRKEIGYMEKYYKENKPSWDKKQKTQEYKDLKNEKRRQRYKEDAEYRERQKQSAKEFQKANPKSRLNQRVRKYGITADDYEKMHEEQGGKCAICGRKDSGDTQAKRFYVDHDHETGDVRGLLCSQCNMGLGKFFDNVDFLRSAIKYLEESGCKK